MRVLHFFKTYLPDSFGGIERVIWELAEGAVRHGLDVDVLSLSADPSPVPRRIGGHLVHQARQDLYVASTGFSLSALAAFRKLARQADVIHYHFPWPFMDIVRLATGVNKPSVVTYHSDIIRQKSLSVLYRPLMQWFLGRADAIVATSPNYVQTSPVLQRHQPRLRVIPIGLDESSATTLRAEDLAALRARLPERFFLFVGALRYYKGLPFLIEAARQTGLPVVIAGDGEMRAEIERAGVPNVFLLGQVSDGERAGLLHLAYAFVFPSHLRSEAFGVALLEAAMAGKPMISCEIGTGTSYVNRDGVTGFVVPPADPVALAAAMQRLWSDPGRAAEMGRGARQRYESTFRAEQMVDAYLALYEEVVASHGKARLGSSG